VILAEMEPAAEDMDNVSKACLSIFAITILAVAVGKEACDSNATRSLRWLDLCLLMFII
jgi:hypothetical protein